MAAPLLQTMVDPAAGAAVGFGIVAGIIFLFFLVITVSILAFVFWLWLLIDCVKRDFKDDTEKVVWILLMIFLGVLASIIYYFVVKREDKNTDKKRHKRAEISIAKSKKEKTSR